MRARGDDGFNNRIDPATGTGDATGRQRGAGNDRIYGEEGNDALKASPAMTGCMAASAMTSSMAARETTFSMAATAMMCWTRRAARTRHTAAAAIDRIAVGGGNDLVFGDDGDDVLAR